jgi:hypothetical protein
MIRSLDYYYVMARKKVTKLNSLMQVRTQYENAWDALEALEANPKSSAIAVAHATADVVEQSYLLEVLSHELNNIYKIQKS